MTGDLLLLVADTWSTTCDVLGTLRNDIGRPPVHEGPYRYVWVIDFPLFVGINATTGKPQPGHHPFCQPHPEDIERLESDPMSVRALAYDLVLNGWELGSGASANTYAPNSSFTMGSAAITFTAKWIGVYYAVTYSLNGGAGSTPTQASVASGGSFTTAAAPTKSGYTFTGWSNGTTSTNASTLISSVSTNITLTSFIEDEVSTTTTTVNIPLPCSLT